MPEPSAAAPATPPASPAGAQGTPPAAPAADEAARMAEKDRMISDLSERVKRSDEMLNAFLMGGAGNPAPAATPPAAPAAQDDVLGLGADFDWVKDGKKALEQTYLRAKTEAKKEALQEARQMYQGEQAAVATRNAFYAEHKDLSGQEPIVHHFANVLDREMPYAAVATKFAEIAKRSRDYLAKLRAPQNPEPAVPVEGAGGMTPPASAPAGGGGKPPTDEEIFKAGFEERSQQLAKKKQPLAQAL